jgi:hypothetical protein
VTCSICKTGELTEQGDCLNGECVASGRLLYANEDVRGSWNVDGTGGGTTADGTRYGTMKVTSVDKNWVDALIAFFYGVSDDVIVDRYGPGALCWGMGV